MIGADRLHPDATVDQQLVTLLAGESAVLRIDSPRPLSLDDLTSPPVFQCTNGFGGQ